MIRVTVRMNGWDEKLANAPERLREHVFKRVRRKTDQLKTRAKRTAPVKSGKLSRAIYGRSYKNPLRASLGISDTARSTTGYYYPSFVAGGEIINIPKRTNNIFFRSGQKVAYGEPALTPSGAPVQWTAERGWWVMIEQQARRSYPQVVARAVKDFTAEMNS